MEKTKTAIVEVDVTQCESLANHLDSYTIPADREDISLPHLSPRQIGNFYLFAVAICHQTSPRDAKALEGVVSSRKIRGWDYLVGRLEYESSRDPRLLTVAHWKNFSSDELRTLYYDDICGDRLTDVTGRSALIRDLGCVMNANRWQYFEDLYNESSRSVETGRINLIELLTKFSAYSDPVKKKSFFLLALMRNTGLWEYVDNDRLGPPVDYHEVRGHLRIGTVKVRDRELSHKLRNHIPVTASEDIAIRQSVMEAIMLVSKLTGKSPSQLHYLFWNIFRACCTRETPHCLSCPSQRHLPERYERLTRHTHGNRCPFSSVCESAHEQKRYYEHLFETDYY